MENIKILGLIFDNKFTWVPHLKKLKSECKNRMKLIKTLSHHSWGAEKNSLLIIYKSLILSKLNYGSIIYSTAKPKTLQTIYPIHNKGIRLSIGAFRTSPIPSILCISGEPPLHIRRLKEILKYVSKKKCLSHHMTNKILTTSNQLTIPKKHLKIIDIYNNLCKNLSNPINNVISIPHPPIPSWNRSLKINKQLLPYNKNNTYHPIIIANFNEIINT